MAEHVIYGRASRASIRQALFAIPQEASAGRSSDALMTRVGMVILGRIKQAFIAKSRGGTDESGDRWAPLSPKTITYSKTRRRGRTKTEKGRGSYPSQALNAKQQSRWWDVYRRGLAMYKGDKGHAAARAWFVLKAEGAQTLLDKYGSQQVEILRDTGLLLNSLSPGVVSSEQIFRIGQGEVVIGTNRKGAAAHHYGIPGRLPQRRLWPEPSKWPSTWWRDVSEQLLAGLTDITIQLVEGAK